jgi:anti-sigma factor RsiW
VNEPLDRELETLHAYADGALSPQQRREVEGYLEGNPQAQQRLQEYQLLRSGLQRLYGPVIDEPIPATLRRFSRQNRWRIPLAAAAAGLLLLAGGTSGWMLRGAAIEHHDDDSYVIAEAAVAYTVYTPEVIHPVEVSAEREGHLAAWLGQRLGVTLRIPGLGEVGQTLVGGRLLSSEYGPGALLMYEASSGERIVLYVCRDDAGHQASALRFAHHDEVSVFYWFDGTLSYAIAARLARADLREIARAAYSEMTSNLNASVDG